MTRQTERLCQIIHHDLIDHYVMNVYALLPESRDNHSTWPNDFRRGLRLHALATGSL